MNKWPCAQSFRDSCALTMRIDKRVRNIERILADPKPVVERWNRLLYPHLTDQTLREVIADPGRYHDPDMARAELADR